jgi:aspartyl aminopeptidase
MNIQKLSPQNTTSFKGPVQNPPLNYLPPMPMPGNLQPGIMPDPALMQAYYTQMPQLPPRPQVKSVWANANPEKKQKIMLLGEHYKKFLDTAKTDLMAVETMLKRASSEGFQPWPADQPNRLLMPGEKFFRVNRDRSVQFIVIGQEPITTGFKMVATHLDSPHITLKAKPLQDAPGDMAIFKTIIHGGIKPRQWTQRNLALVGKVIRQDGSEVKINIGNKPGDPVFVIPELAIHVDGGKSEIKPENLNPIVGTNEPDSLSPGAEGKVSTMVEQLLFQQYGITRDDLIHAQLDLVPADEARDSGFDRSLVSGYGSDDKSAAFAGLEAMISATKQQPIPRKTLISTNFGNEEVSSWNNYGAKSSDTETMIGEILKYTTGRYDHLDMQKAFRNSLIISADVTTAIDPIRPDGEEATNSTKLGFGPSIQKEGKLYSTPEASAKFMNMIRGTQTQTHAFNQDKGGGGTVGLFLSTQHNADVVDFGIPILGMHAPTELVHKADLYELTSALMGYYLH